MSRRNPAVYPEMEIDLVPLAQFSERVSRGWRMVPGYPLQPGDYVVTMQAPDFPKPLSNIRLAARRANQVKREEEKKRAIARDVS